jgi:hypothetical protein
MANRAREDAERKGRMEWPFIAFLVVCQFIWFARIREMQRRIDFHVDLFGEINLRHWKLTGEYLLR